MSRFFFEAVLNQARQLHLLSNQHFTVDGTLLESWASLKSLKPRRPNLGGQRKPKPGSRRPPSGGVGRTVEVDFHGQKRSNDTTSPAPTRRHGWRARAKARKPNSASPATS